MQNNNRYTQAIEQIASNFQQTLQSSGMLPNDYLSVLREKLEKEFFSLLQAPKPKIMVYGIYNSGKSTLVNALCGKAVAEVADRPMTWRVAEYDVGKYILIDSPGVDAPIEHERIADSQLKKCHIVLFVISSKGNFESRTNYEKMLPLIQTGIPFYIILNDRGAVVSKNMSEEQRIQARIRHELELDEIKRKIIRNLIKVSGDESIGDRYEVIAVNAKRAWLGVEQGKPKLIENSSISVLRSRMEQILEEQGAMKWLHAPLSALDGCIGDAEARLISMQGGSDYAIERQTLQAKVDGMRSTLIGKLQDCVYSHRDEAYNLCRNDNDMEGIAEAVIQEMGYACQQEYRKVSNYIDEKFPDYSAKFGVNTQVDTASTTRTFVPGQEAGRCVSYGNAGGADAFEADHLPNGAAASAFAGGLFQTVLGTFLSKTAGSISPTDVIKLPLGAGTTAVPLLKILGDLLKSREKKEQEKYERLLLEAERNNRAIEDRVAEEMRCRQDARTRAYAYLDDLKREIQQLLLSEVDEKLAAVLQSLDAVIRERRQIDAAVCRLLEQLRGMKNNLAAIRLEIV